MAKRAINLTVTTFTAECPCGGEVVNLRGSYMLDPSDAFFCDSCGDKLTIGKTVRL